MAKCGCSPEGMYITIWPYYHWEYEPAIMNKIYILVGSYSLCWLTRHGCWCYWSKTKLRKTKTCVLMIINGTLVRLHLDLSPNPFWESNHGFLLDRGFLIAMIPRGKILQLKSPLISTLIIHSNTCQGKGSGNWSETGGVPGGVMVCFKNLHCSMLRRLRVFP